MTPTQVRDALRSAILAGRLTPDEASGFLAALASGSLASPVTGRGVAELLSGSVASGLVRALIATGLLSHEAGRSVLRDRPAARGRAGRQYSAAVARLERLPMAARVDATITSAGGWDRDAFRLAARVTGYRGAPGFTDPGPRISPREFRARVAKRLADEHVLNAVAGLGRPLSRDDVARLRPVLDAELKRLDAFVAEIAAREHAGRPHSRRYIMERLRMYEGNARAQFYLLGEARDAKRFDGMVYDVEGSDDGNTCGPCAAGMENGPYLAGQGFIPGRDCLGRGKCRHRRVGRVDAAEHARLSEAAETVAT